ncbi:MAG: response regulator [Nitrospiraceae bacterium]|jgi:CheY-like chemotaxis protein|nr:response regulator [Nitrospiraceae bacterium]
MSELVGPVEILLVEDNPYDAELTMRALRSHHLTNSIYWVTDGQEAIDFLFCQGRFSNRPPHPVLKLVLLDIKLPKLDGTEVLRVLKSREETRFTPVVMLTSSTEEQDLFESYNLGVNSYIVKPVEFEKFMKTVSDAGLYWTVMNRLPDGSAEAGGGSRDPQPGAGSPGRGDS